MHIRASTPLRVSLAGGGNDLPEYFIGRGARLLSVAIAWRLQVDIGTDVAHHASSLTNWFRTLFPSLGVRISCPVTPGAGLGGSGALAVCLIAVKQLIERGSISDPLTIALEAFDLERNQLGEPVGFQDHVVSALGGCVEMRATAAGKIDAHTRPKLTRCFKEMLQSSVVMAESGVRRPASTILRRLAASYRQGVSGTDKQCRAGGQEPQVLRGPARVADVSAAISARDGDYFGRLLHMHWEAKRARLPTASNSGIDHLIELIIHAGATGGKIIGAGGGGFLLASGPPQRRHAVSEALRGAGCDVVAVDVDTTGVEIMESINHSPKEEKCELNPIKVQSS